MIGGANDNEIGADGANLAGNQIFDTAHKGKSEDNTGDADGNTKAGEKRACAVLLEGSFGKVVVSAEKKRHYFLAPLVDFLVVFDAFLVVLGFLEDFFAVVWGLGSGSWVTVGFLQKRTEMG